ncbi:MAG: DUF4384 domain-containing protein [Myxococcales bacterium]|nr:DUF4384 domain-containing protein [Myxococcales bacterium]
MTWTTRERGEDCLSDLVLDQLRVGELAASLATRARSHVIACDRCRARQRELDEDAASATLPPLPASPPETIADISPAPPRRRAWPAVAGLTAAAAAAVLAIVSLLEPPRVGGDGSRVETGGPEPAATRSKGAPALQVFIRRDGAVLEGSPGAVVHPGDALRFAYSWTESGYVAVLGRDGAGAVNVYVPTGDRARPVAPGERAMLPDAVALDDVVGEEVLYGVFCAREPSLAALERAVAARPDAPAIPGCQVDRVRLDKRARR